MAGDNATLVFRWIQWKYSLQSEWLFFCASTFRPVFNFLWVRECQSRKPLTYSKGFVGAVERFCLRTHSNSFELKLVVIFQVLFKQFHLRRIPIFNLSQHLVLNICLGWEEKRLLGLVTFGGSAFQARAVAVSRVLYVSRPAPDPHLKGQYALNGGGWI